jgi:hypothetical protein
MSLSGSADSDRSTNRIAGLAEIERFRHRIARDLRIAGERQHRAPQPVAPLPVQALDLCRA